MKNNLQRLKNKIWYKSSKLGLHCFRFPGLQCLSVCPETCLAKKSYFWISYILFYCRFVLREVVTAVITKVSVMKGVLPLTSREDLLVQEKTENNNKISDRDMRCVRRYYNSNNRINEYKVIMIVKRFTKYNRLSLSLYGAANTQTFSCNWKLSLFITKIDDFLFNKNFC